MNKRIIETYKNEKVLYKMIVTCDCEICKQPEKEFAISQNCKSVKNNYFLCPSCVQRQPKVRDKLVKSATNQWKTKRTKMVESIRIGNSKPEARINKSIATKNAWDDPNKRESMMDARKPGSKYYDYIQSLKNNKEYSQMISEKVSNLYLEGKIHYNKKVRYKTGWFYSNKSNINIYYRSSLELKYLEFFEVCENIINFIPAPFKIKYIDPEGIIRNYCPDFLVKTINKTYLVEVKPRALFSYYNNLLKFAVAKIYCKENKILFKILTEEHCNKEFVNKFIK